MVKSTMGPLVPSSVKSEQPPSTSTAAVEAAPPDQPHPPPPQEEPLPSAAAANEEDRLRENGDGIGHDQSSEAVVDNDFLCPICMQIIRDAFLTACGHSYCYMCITTHLRHKSDCPCCGRYLVMNHIFPNFALDKVLKKMSDHQLAKNTTPLEQLCQAMRKGCDVSIKEVDNLLSLLIEKKRKIEREEAETNMQILLEFLSCMKRRKLEELNEDGVQFTCSSSGKANFCFQCVKTLRSAIFCDAATELVDVTQEFDYWIQKDLNYIKEDIIAVEKRGIELNLSRKGYPSGLRLLTVDSDSTRPCSSAAARTSSLNGRCTKRTSIPVIPSKRKKRDSSASPCADRILQNNDSSGSESQHITESVSLMKRKRLIHEQFNELQDCYLQKRRQCAKSSGKDSNIVNRVGYNAGLEDFQSVLTAVTRYSQLKVIAELRHGDIFHSANIISSVRYKNFQGNDGEFNFESIEFDRNDELFATAGVSRLIKVFEFLPVVNEPAEVHCPIVEMASRAKLSCLSWNKYTKSHIASSDYDGIVTIWDASTRQSVMEYEEHEKRAWSVDFSCIVPTMLVSGSDDCKVKIWCTRQETSALSLSMKANVCSVKFNPGSSYHLAVGSADHRIFFYDLRNISQPLNVFTGHRKAVSYVKFLSSNELASASTDSTLRLWDVKENSLLQTYKGHRNEKNFVGLSVNSQYLVCGSETNEVFCYHKALCRPAARHSFNSSEQDETEEDSGSYFTSAVCWKSDNKTLLAANSNGTIKVLALAA